MARDLRFSIDGDPSGGIDAFKRLRAEGEATAKALGAAMSSVAGMVGSLTSITGSMRALREGATATSRSIRSMSDNLSGVGARSREVTAMLKQQAAEVNKATQALKQQRAETAAVEKSLTVSVRQATALRAGMTAAAAQTGVFRAGLTSSASILARMVTQAAVLANRLAVGARSAGLAMRSTGAASAQGLQGLGIGFRMSGIAVGNQLANIGGNGISGFLGGAVGAAAAGAEMAVRLVSSLTGTAIRLLGGAANLILAPIGALAQGIGDVVGTVFTKAIGGTIQMGLQAAGHFVGAITNIVGELASQVGNIFTGIMEAARGAFQGAVSIATSLLGKLVDVVSSVAEKIGGVLGTIGKTVLGVGGTLAGFALHDFTDTESGLMKGVVLLDNKLSAGDKKALREWAEDLHRQMPTITRDALGTTFQRVVSTGFSGDLAGAKKATEAATRLQFGTEGGGDPADAARVIAKIFSVYKDEMSKFADPLQGISDLLFQTVNAADISLADLVTHLGQVIGPAKALGLSLEDLLVLIAKMSRTADTEQTFTGLRRLILEPLKMSKDAAGILAKHGLHATTLSPEEESAIREKQRVIADKQAELAALESNKRRAPEENKQAAKQRALAIAEAEAKITEARTPFQRKQAQKDLAELRVALAREAASSTGTPRADATERISALKHEIHDLKKELTDFQGTSGSVTNLSKFLADLTKAGIPAKELAKVFPDIRALTAAMTLSSQDPKMASAIEGMIRGATGKTGDAVKEQAETVKVKLLQVWEGLKAPFISTLNSMEGPFKSFLDKIVGGLQDLNKWWQQTIAHPGGSAFFDNLGSKVGGLLGGISLKGISSGEFWRGLETGLNSVWDLGRKVVGVFTTLGGLIGEIASQSETLRSVWDGLKSAGKWVGETVGQLSKGSTKNLDDAWAAGKGAFDTIWQRGKDALKPIIATATDIFNKVADTAVKVGAGIVSAFNVVVAGLKAVLPLLGAYALAPAARAIGAAFRPPTAALGAGGAAGAVGGAGGGGAAGGAAGALAAAAGAAGFLRRDTVYNATYGMPGMRPTSSRVAGMSNREWEAFRKRGGTAGMIGPMTPPVYGGFQGHDEFNHQPWALGGVEGNPGLMGPENDALYRGRGAFALTPAEAAAFAARRTGSAGPQQISPAEMLADPGSWTMRERMGLGARRLGGVAMRGVRGAARWATSAGGMAAMQIGGMVGGAALEESGSPALGGAMQGASMGSLGFSIGPVVGAFTTAIGAVVGALGGLASSVTNTREALDASARKDVASLLGDLGNEGKTFDQQMRTLTARAARVSAEDAAAGVQGSSPRSRAALDASDRLLENEARGALSQILGGDVAGGLPRLKAAQAWSPDVVKAAGKNRGIDIDNNQMTRWEDEARRITESVAKSGEETSQHSKQIASTLKTLAEDIDLAESNLQNGLFKEFAGNASELTEMIANAKAAMKLTDDAGLVDQFKTLIRAASDLTTTLDTTGAAMRADAAFNPTRDVPALGPIFNPTIHPLNFSDPEAPKAAGDGMTAVATGANAAASALPALAAATKDTADAVKKAAGSMRVAGSMTIPTSSSPFPGNANMTAGEARQLRKQMRHEAHMARNRSHEQYDQFGNKIDGFTGMPSVGEFGGVSFGGRSGDSTLSKHDDWFRQHPGAPSSSFPGASPAFAPSNSHFMFDPTKPLPSTPNPVAGPNGSLVVPSPGGGAAGGGMAGVAGAAKATAGDAKEAAGATKEATGAIKETGDAMKETADASNETAKTARKSVEVTRNKLEQVHAEMNRLQAEIDALESQSVSAGDAGN